MNIRELYNIFLNSEGICTDSRKAVKGQLFFALRGDNFNGNQYALKALEIGCSFAVVDDGSLPANDRFIVVHNSLEKLQELANFHRRTLGIPIIAITGTNGKTTTKELMARVLSKKYKLFATEGNFNNHIGVPLSLLRLKDEEMAIIEMGANHQFEIDELCQIADPDYGLITNIGKAHLEGFGSFEVVIKTKTELYRYLDKKNGVVLINGSNPVLKEEIQKTTLEQYSYISGKNLLCEGFIKSEDLFLSLDLKFTGSNEIHVSTKLTGDYNLENILAAACTGKYFGVEESAIVEALESYIPSNNRSQFFSTDKNTLILDSYNANPASMTGAITNFLRIEKTPKMMILGDMLELGEWSDEEHNKILQQLKAADFNDVHLVGKLFSEVAKNSPYPVYGNVEKLIEYFSLNPVNNNLILLKGSRGIKLERLLEVL